MKIYWKCLITFFAVTIIFSGAFFTRRVLAQSLLNDYQLQPSEMIAGVRVEMSVSPSTSQPQEPVTLELVMINTTDQDVSPELYGVLPQGIDFDPNDLQTGASYDVATRRWLWRPYVPAGQQRHFALPFSVQSATVEDPIHQLSAVFHHLDQKLPLTADYWVGSLPTAAISIPSRISVGQPITLSAAITGPLPIVQNWKLGDGRQVDSSNSLVVYQSVGSYQIDLQVTNPLGSYTTSQEIVVVPEPSADFTLEDLTPGIDQPVRFINYSGGQPPLRYRWDFGDGTSSAEENPIHTYRQPGHYVIQLAVENALGSVLQEQKMIVGTPPVVDVTLPVSTTVGIPINALGLGSAESDSLEYRWNMGDGNFANGENIEHFYANPGLYAVTMTALNQYGATQLTKIVEVKKSIHTVYLPVVMNNNNVTPQFQTYPDYVIEIDQVDLFGDEPPANTSQTEQLLWYINRARISFNLKPVALVRQMSIAAQRHTNDMAFNRFTAHTGSDGSSPVDRLKQSGYTGIYRGEATAWGFDHPTGAVGFWLQSPPHRAILLNATPTDVGVGYTYDPTAPSIHYWTFEFGSGVTNGLDWPVNAPPIEPTPVPTPTVVVVEESTPETAGDITPMATLENLPTDLVLPLTQVDVTPTVEFVATPALSETIATPIVGEVVETVEPTAAPTPELTPESEMEPTLEPTAELIVEPTAEPTAEPTVEPTTELTVEPTAEPTAEPTVEPTAELTTEPTAEPTAEPTIEPTEEVTAEPTEEVTAEPTEEVTAEPTAEVTIEPTAEVTAEPTAEPTIEPTAEPTIEPTTEVTAEPTAELTIEPTTEVTAEPTAELIVEPTTEPTLPVVTIVPEVIPTDQPTPEPVLEPTLPVVTIVPEVIPTDQPTPEAASEESRASSSKQEKTDDSAEIVLAKFLLVLMNQPNAQTSDLVTPALQQEIADKGLLAVAQLAALPGGYGLLASRLVDANHQSFFVRFDNVDGIPYQREFNLSRLDGSWRIANVVAND